MKYLLSIFIVIFLTACTDSTSTTVSTNNNIKIGYFIDSPVQGVQYKCGASIGITDKNGKFEYTQNCGDILFYIGNITIGKYPSSKIDKYIYPSELAGVSINNTDDNNVLNIIRFLQTLDDNNNTYDGIQITDSTRNNLSNYKQIFLQDSNLTEANLQDIISAGKPGQLLLDINTSKSNYEYTLRENGFSIDTVPPSKPTLLKKIDEIDLLQTTQEVTVIAEPLTTLSVKCDNINIKKSIPKDGKITFTLFFDNLNTDYFDINLTLTDSYNKISNSNIVHLKRRDIIPPVINIAKIDNLGNDIYYDSNDQSYTFNIYENETFIQNINASDNSNDKLTCNRVNKSEDPRSEDFDLFNIENCEIKFKNQQDYDSDIDRVYKVVVSVKDDSNNTTYTFIKVKPINILDSPPILINDENTSYICELSEYLEKNNSKTVYDLNNTLLWDRKEAPDNDLGITYFKFFLENNTDIFDVNITTGIITVKDENNSLFDYEQSPNSVQLKFRIENNNTLPEPTAENNTTYGYLDINITNVVDTPPYLEDIDEITIPEHNSSFDIDENVTIATINLSENSDFDDSTTTFKITAGNDINKSFKIDTHTGVISVSNKTLDFETQVEYNLTIESIAQYTDDKNSIIDDKNETDTKNLIVHITNVVDTVPTIKIDTLENVQAEQIKDSDEHIIGKIVIDGDFNDENKSTDTYNITTTQSLFDINSSTGEITRKSNLSSLYTETEDNNSISQYTFEVVYKNRWWNDKNNNTHSSKPISIDLNITNVIDNAPVLKSPPSYDISFDENYSVPNNGDGTPKGTLIFDINVSGSNYDENNTTKYIIISGNSDNTFEINLTTGEITLLDLLDYETYEDNNSYYNFCYIATNIWFDGREHNSTKKCVSIIVNNMIEKVPDVTIVDNNISIHENIDSNTFISLIKANSSASIDEKNITSITISNGNDGNFKLGNLEKSNDYLQFARLFTSDNCDLDYESNNSYSLELNISNPAGDTIKYININIIDDVDSEIPLVIIAMNYTDINISEGVADTKNKIFKKTDNYNSVNRYLEKITNGKVEYVKAKETYGTKDDGYIKVDINSSHPKNDEDKLKQNIIDALNIANNDINISLYDTNNNQILESNELKIVFISAGGERVYNDDNLSIYGKLDKFTEDIITLDDVNITIGKGYYSIIGEKQNNYYATIGLVTKQLLQSTFGFEPQNADKGIDYGKFDILSDGYKGYDKDEINGTRPIYTSCYNRASQGWITPYELKYKKIYGVDYNLSLNTFNYSASTNENKNCIKINTNNTNIYYLIENRNSNVQSNSDMFYDNGLYMLNNETFDGGLRIWRIDGNTIDFIKIDDSNNLNIYRSKNNKDKDLNTDDFNFIDPNLQGDKKLYNIGIRLND